MLYYTAWKLSFFEVFLVRIFPHSDGIRRYTRKNSEYRHFSCSATTSYWRKVLVSFKNNIFVHKVQFLHNTLLCYRLLLSILVDTGRKFTVQKMFKRCLGCLLYVLYTFNLCHISSRIGTLQHLFKIFSSTWQITESGMIANVSVFFISLVSSISE